jgi:hypothetical protein
MRTNSYRFSSGDQLLLLFPGEFSNRDNRFFCQVRAAGEDLLPDLIPDIMGERIDHLGELAVAAYGLLVYFVFIRETFCGCLRLLDILPRG